MTRHAVMLNRVEEGLLSVSDVAKADDIKLQEITENAERSMENLIVQLKGGSSEDLPMHELLSLEKQLIRIRSSLKVEVSVKVQLEQRIWQEKNKLETIPESTLKCNEKKSRNASLS